MNREELRTQIQDIFREVFRDEHIVISDGTSSNDIGAWDSLTHLRLIMQMEKHFGIKFTTAQIRDMKTAGDMMDTIAGKAGQD